MSEEPVEVSRQEKWNVVFGLLSLGLGLISPVSCGLGIVPGVPALLLGIIACRKSRRTGKRMQGFGLGAAGILFACIGIALCLALMTDLWKPKPVHGPSCQNNLKGIGACLKMYAGENNGAFPDRLSRLYPDYAEERSLPIFICPDSGNKPGDPARIDEWSEYTYVSGLHPTGTTGDAEVLVCYDSEYRHVPKGRNELFLDGHAEFHKQGQPHQSSDAGQP